MVKKVSRKLVHGAHDLMFKNIHGRRLIYNTCWEDPRLDREMLKFDSESSVVMITSAGCNALDYLLDDVNRIDAVDVNFRQNSLIQLKMHMFRRGSYADLWQLFGTGLHENWKELYAEIRPELPDYAQEFWNKRFRYFNPKNILHKTFYYRGASGDVAWILRNSILRAKKKIRSHVFDMIDAKTQAEQVEIFKKVEEELWDKLTSWLMKQPVVLAGLGVPRPQIDLIQNTFEGGVAGFVKHKLKHVMTEVPVQDNYFWRVYITGKYTPDCCPNYLKEANFKTYQERVDRIHTHNTTVANFLKENPGKYSHYILLDHQDWLAAHNIDALNEEWELILENSKPGTKILMRSASPVIDFIPDFANSRLKFFPEITDDTHPRDRVGTYGCTLLAEVTS